MQQSISVDTTNYLRDIKLFGGNYFPAAVVIFLKITPSEIPVFIFCFDAFPITYEEPEPEKKS